MVNFYSLLIANNSSLPDNYRLIFLIDPVESKLFRLGLIKSDLPADDLNDYKPISLSQDYLYLIARRYNLPNKYNVIRFKVKWTTPLTYKEDKPFDLMDNLASYHFNNRESETDFPNFIQSKTASFALHINSFFVSPFFIDAFTKERQLFQLDILNNEEALILALLEYAYCDDGLKLLCEGIEQDYRITKQFFNEVGPPIKDRDFEVLPNSWEANLNLVGWIHFLKKNIAGFKGINIQGVLYKYISENVIFCFEDNGYSQLTNSNGKIISERKYIDYDKVFNGCIELLDSFFYDFCNVAVFDYKNQFWQKLIYSEES